MTARHRADVVPDAKSGRYYERPADTAAQRPGRHRTVAAHELELAAEYRALGLTPLAADNTPVPS